VFLIVGIITKILPLCDVHFFAIMLLKHIFNEPGGRHSVNLMIIQKIHAFIPKKKQEFSSLLQVYLKGGTEWGKQM